MEEYTAYLKFIETQQKDNELGDCSFARPIAIVGAAGFVRLVGQFLLLF